MVTRSPGSAPSTNTALPSTRAMPRPSWSSDSMVTGAFMGGVCDKAAHSTVQPRERERRKMRRMKLLALESSTDWISVAAGDGESWHVRDELASNAHSERVMPLVREVLADAGWGLRELDAVAFGAGPGAFTGVRIACGIAQGLALGAGLPVVPVGTLEALAEEAWRVHGHARVLAVLDARMREVYVGAYRR